MKPTCLTLFSGLGGGALGFQRAGFELVGGFDSWDAACRDYEYLTGSKAHCVDLGTLMPDELRALSGERRPDVVFTSPPCKGFSACVGTKRSKSEKYQTLNSFAERGVWIALEAWEEPPPVILIENVTEIQSKGRKWLEAVKAMLTSYGYAYTESTHDCGVLGGLAQSRRRFLLVARHMAQVPEFIYEPPRQIMRSVGEVFEQLPVPAPKRKKGQPGGPLHALGKLSDLNWLRLALIPPGGDYRDLPEQVMITPRTRGRCEGVTRWSDTSTTVIGQGDHFNGPWQVADPRVRCTPRATAYGVQGLDGQSNTVVGAACHDNGRYSRVADVAYATHCTLEHEGELYVAGPPLDMTERNSTHTYRVIRSHHSGAWHRPMTVLELAALQGLPVKVGGAWLKLDGGAKKAWKERIGNAVPPPTAQAIAETIKRSLEASQRGQFLMGAEPVWVEEHAGC